MRDSRLDNPMWHALQGPHRGWAQGGVGLQWFPQDVVPFVAVSSAEVALPPDPPTALRIGERAFFVGSVPRAVPPGWNPREASEVVQMIYVGETPLWEPASHRLLGPADRPAMRELAMQAFPDFFRPRSPELGSYIGVFEAGELVSMAGERMALESMREISAICTHPRYRGRGHAGGVTRALIRRHREQGLHSFLHVSARNVAARALYTRLGFVEVAVLPMLSIGPTAA